MSINVIVPEINEKYQSVSQQENILNTIYYDVYFNKNQHEFSLYKG